MKNAHRWLVALFVVGLVASIAGHRIALALRDVPDMPGAMLPPDGEARDAYRIELRLAPERAEVEGRQTMTYINHSSDTLTDAVFELFPNGYFDAAKPPFDPTDPAIYPMGFDAGGITIDGVRVNGATAAFEIEGDQSTSLRVRLPGPLLPGQSLAFAFDFTTRLPHAYTPMGWSEQGYRLDHVYPIAAAYVEGAFRAYGIPQVGRATVSECADYRVTLTAPDGYTLATAGVVTSTRRAAGETTYEIEGASLRAWSAALQSDVRVIGRRVGDTTVYVHARSMHSGEALLSHACAALETFERLYGPYPYPALTIAEAKLAVPHVPGATIGFLDSSVVSARRAADLEVEAARIVALQYFEAMVGSDPFESGWMSDGIAEYAVARYFEARYGEAAKQVFFDQYIYADYNREEGAAYAGAGKAVDDLVTRSEYDAIVRAKSAMMMLDIETLAGVDGTTEALRLYVERMRYRIAVPQDVRDAIDDATGGNYGGLMDDYLKAPR